MLSSVFNTVLSAVITFTGMWGVANIDLSDDIELDTTYPAALEPTIDSGEQQIIMPTAWPNCQTEVRAHNPHHSHHFPGTINVEGQWWSNGQCPPEATAHMIVEIQINRNGRWDTHRTPNTRVNQNGRVNVATSCTAGNTYQVRRNAWLPPSLAPRNTFLPVRYRDGVPNASHIFNVHCGR